MVKALSLILINKPAVTAKPKPLPGKQIAPTNPSGNAAWIGQRWPWLWSVFVITIHLAWNSLSGAVADIFSLVWVEQKVAKNILCSSYVEFWKACNIFLTRQNSYYWIFFKNLNNLSISK